MDKDQLALAYAQFTFKITKFCLGLITGYLFSKLHGKAIYLHVYKIFLFINTHLHIFLFIINIA